MIILDQSRILLSGEVLFLFKRTILYWYHDIDRIWMAINQCHSSVGIWDDSYLPGWLNGERVGLMT